MSLQNPTITTRLTLAGALFVAAGLFFTASLFGGQVAVSRVELMPNHPRPYVMRDWKKVARDYDAFVFDFDKKGDHLPLIWPDKSKANYPFDGFGIYSYVGNAYQRNAFQKQSGAGEGINCIAAVIGGTLAGVDKSRQDGRNFVLMCQRYFNKDTALGLYMNGTRHGTGGTFWYETYPSLLFAQLLDLYPGTGEMDEHLTISAERMYEAVMKMRGGDGVPDFDHTAFDYNRMEPRDNGRWKEPDAAAGYAWFQYMAYTKTGNPKYLKCADLCMQFLERRRENPFYEVLLPYGAYLAARMNAELGREYDVHKLIEWCFGPSEARRGWGVIAEKWGNVDAAGLAGSLTDGGGYAFAMNTFDQAAAMAPLARYDDRYARAMGKYILNLANSARLFYANAHADEYQNCAAWAHKYDPDYCIAYEGCRKLARRSLKADADYKTTAGAVIAGDYRDTQMISEANGKRYESLREGVRGDHYRLEHIWRIRLEPALHRWLHLYGRCEGDEGFVFSYAAKVEGPYTRMFTVKAKNDAKHHWGIPADMDGELYVKVEDTSRTAGENRPDTLHVDSLFVMYEFERSPFGMGDGGVGGFPRDVATDFGLYGSSHVGYLGAIVETTDVQEILQLDLLKTDWHHDKAYPTYLYFNPYETAKTIELDVGPEPRDVYDAVSNRYLAGNTKGPTAIRISADSAVITVVCPAQGRTTFDKSKTLIDGVIVDYNNERASPSP